MFKIKLLASAAATCVLGAIGSPTPANAYPIDCAILLCLAGGFPASTECTAAKAEMIRRITPVPVEPPLQLWNCPMGLSADVASAIGPSAMSLGSDGLTPDVWHYRDAIELFDVKYRRYREDHGTRVSDNTRSGYYDQNGTFRWKGASFESGPGWLVEAVGGSRVPIYQTYGRNREYQRVIGYRNQPSLAIGTLRAIVMRFKDYKGVYYTEVVRY
ncbi:hypothetical protein [Ensifer sp. SL37]|uniref:hypothetical protein n=1 Tax=Ensifer sp. SL37 TaxID=2995137 RepID=UPI002275656D|nr:hypothetical protein [Ensifer sp. SL37]MCY1740997.1 hypothetical protein [Ensifer sp. SL37]